MSLMIIRALQMSLMMIRALQMSLMMIWALQSPHQLTEKSYFPVAYVTNSSRHQMDTWITWKSTKDNFASSAASANEDTWAKSTMKPTWTDTATCVRTIAESVGKVSSQRALPLGMNKTSMVLDFCVFYDSEPLTEVDASYMFNSRAYILNDHVSSTRGTLRTKIRNPWSFKIRGLRYQVQMYSALKFLPGNYGLSDHTFEVVSYNTGFARLVSLLFFN